MSKKIIHPRIDKEIIEIKSKVCACVRACSLFVCKLNSIEIVEIFHWNGISECVCVFFVSYWISDWWWSLLRCAELSWFSLSLYFVASCDCVCARVCVVRTYYEIWNGKWAVAIVILIWTWISSLGHGSMIISTCSNYYAFPICPNTHTHTRGEREIKIISVQIPSEKKNNDE